MRRSMPPRPTRAISRTSSRRRPHDQIPQEGALSMNLAWLAAGIALGFGVLRPRLGVGVLTPQSSEAMGRNPDAPAVIPPNMIIGAPPPGGLGVLPFLLRIPLSRKTA